ncbi:uncharacterized protein LOC112201658 [Rosa chinensis]|uniref:uncharacterized protein LOC112201658 n=1 Tax=Rosa chinensis TaxID=74649 RepID=UPI001AD94773|nr:uncharacterized protein LOC112201658 [Rosa chinensis]
MVFGLYRSGAKRQFCKLLRKESRTQNKILYFISLVFKTRSISCQADNNDNKSDLHPLLWADSIILEVMDLIKGWRSCAVTTLGRDGSDLTATTIGKARWQELDHVVEELERIVVVNLFRTDQ